jgi:hypothetical protein
MSAAQSRLQWARIQRWARLQLRPRLGPREAADPTLASSALLYQTCILFPAFYFQRGDEPRTVSNLHFIS